jgi:collagenase-like PrtC family protease
MDEVTEKLELTAPAGGMMQLVAAVNAGADSVYLGYEKFGARAYADNFDINQLKRAVRYAHSKGVKIYLTINTLIKDNEIGGLLEFLKEYSEFCKDGLIIQDLCVYRIIKDLFKDIPLHASTQMSLHNIYSLKFINRLGFKRVIPAREMTLNEIKGLCKKNLAKIEIFIHGSQCYSYSGSCYFSSFIGGRSGNRGRCTQPCRMKYRMVEEIDGNRKYVTDEGYILSKSDLCLIEFLPEIAKAGVHALKIEGRMKSEEYVGIVTKVYRKYIDLYYSNPERYAIDEYDIYKLTQIFSRELGEGYIMNRYPREIISIKKSGSIGNFIGRIHKVDYSDVKKKKIENIYIKSKWGINKGDIIEVWTKKGSCRISIKYIEELENDRKKYLYRIKIDRLSNILKKDRVFKYFDKKINDEAGELLKYDKNDAVSGASKNQGSKDKKKTEDYLKKYLKGGKVIYRYESKEILGVRSRVYGKDFLQFALGIGARNIIYSGLGGLIKNGRLNHDITDLMKKYIKDKGVKICIDTPHIIYDDDFETVRNIITGLIGEGVKNFRVSNPGVLELLMEIKSPGKKKDVGVYLSTDFNLFNTITVNFFEELIGRELTLKGMELSPELKLGEISGIISNMLAIGKNLKNREPEFSIFGHGYFKIMSSRYKLDYITGDKKKGKFYLEDEKGYMFPVASDYNGNMTIFNSRNICTIFDLDKIEGSNLNSIIVDSRFYTREDFKKILNSYREASKILFDKGVKEYKSFISNLKGDSLFSNYSKGHLFRGVE